MAKNSKGCAVVYCSNTYYNVARSEKKISFFRLPRYSQRYTKFHIAYYETLAMCFSCRLRSYTFQYHYCHGDPFKIIQIKANLNVYLCNCRRKRNFKQRSIESLFCNKYILSALTFMHLFCRCKQWVINCKTVNLDNKTSEQLYSNYLVCGEHFEDRMFMNPITRNSLVHNAIPTVFAFPGDFTSSPLF